jgi:hypothetical protein
MDPGCTVDAIGSLSSNQAVVRLYVSDPACLYGPSAQATCDIGNFAIGGHDLPDSTSSRPSLARKVHTSSRRGAAPLTPGRSSRAGPAFIDAEIEGGGSQGRSIRRVGCQSCEFVEHSQFEHCAMVAWTRWPHFQLLELEGGGARLCMEALYLFIAMGWVADDSGSNSSRAPRPVSVNRCASSLPFLQPQHACVQAQCQHEIDFLSLILGHWFLRLLHLDETGHHHPT